MAITIYSQKPLPFFPCTFSFLSLQLAIRSCFCLFRLVCSFIFVFQVLSSFQFRNSLSVKMLRSVAVSLFSSVLSTNFIDLFKNKSLLKSVLNAGRYTTALRFDHHVAKARNILDFMFNSHIFRNMSLQKPSLESLLQSSRKLAQSLVENSKKFH